MSIRLNKILSEFNVGISTVMDILEKNGIFLFEVTPATKISDEHYELIAKTLGKGKRIFTIPWREDKFVCKRLHNCVL